MPRQHPQRNCKEQLSLWLMCAWPPFCAHVHTHTHTHVTTHKTYAENLSHTSFSLCSWRFQVEREGTDLWPIARLSEEGAGERLTQLKEEGERLLDG